MIWSTELRGGNLDDFQKAWGMVMLRVVHRPSDEQLEVLAVDEELQATDPWSGGAAITTNSTKVRPPHYGD